MSVMSNLHLEICTMLEDGSTAEEIAKVLGIPQEMVEAVEPEEV